MVRPRPQTPQRESVAKPDDTVRYTLCILYAILIIITNPGGKTSMQYFKLLLLHYFHNGDNITKEHVRYIFENRTFTF